MELTQNAVGMPMYFYVWTFINVFMILTGMFFTGKNKKVSLCIMGFALISTVMKVVMLINHIIYT